MPENALFLGLGSNQGDRGANIDNALALLENRLNIPCSALSSIIETESWGFSGPSFLNCAVRFDVPRFDCSFESKAIEILGICKSIEREMGRCELMETDAEGRRIYHSRPIDIDILLFGNLRMKTPILTIPHPLMKQRDFVMIPLNEIMPDIQENFLLL